MPHPVSWGCTLHERISYAGMAQRAHDHDLFPLTVAETAARANIHVMNERAYAKTFAWPQWDVAPGMFVQVHGLKSRRDLEGCVAQVSGLCHETQRVGIRLEDRSVIYVLLQRLSPAAVDTAVADATGPLVAAVADCDVAEGDGGIAYDHEYFLALKEVALAYIRRAATDELGVSFDRIVADMAT